MSCYLIILYNTVRSIEYDIIVPTEFKKFYSSSLSYLIYFVLSLSDLNCSVCDVFVDLFSSLISLVFF